MIRKFMNNEYFVLDQPRQHFISFSAFHDFISRWIEGVRGKQFLYIIRLIFLSSIFALIFIKSYIFILATNLAYHNNLFLIQSTHMEVSAQLQTKVPSSNVSEISQNESSLDRSFQSCTNVYDFCVHLINKTDQSVDSQYVNAEDNLTLQECMTILQDKLKRAMNDVVFKSHLEEEPLPKQTLLSEFVRGPDSDLYVFYEGIKPIIKQVQKEILYDSITKYSYLDEKKFVKVYIELPNIGAHPADKITSRFLDRSFEIRINEFNGKNWIFAVPKTQCLILTKSSKITVKPNKIIVSLAKMAEADNWFSLHKVKCIGEKDTD